MLFLHERPTPRFWIAAAGIFLGVYLAVRERSRLTDLEEVDVPAATG
jgi:drug/metabolite transporter (DMT)-like permease